jgi:neutral ceramidase
MRVQSGGFLLLMLVGFAVPVTGQEPCPGFCAGFGRADITPPPGVGLAGNGPEGKRAVGYRVRLHVRALVLQDARGERVALVVADLAHVSPTLHRLTADRVNQRTGLTADRLVISATHTHAGPGHFYSEKQYNRFGSTVPGYDTAVVNFLVERFSTAIMEAWTGLRPARAAWGQVPVWGFTRNRSYSAYLMNKPEWTPPFPVPAGLDPVHRAVDPTWTMLRVDLLGDDGNYHPAGAFSLFAIHGTANPPDNDLIDADIHGLLERGLEPEMAGVHLVANGTEGDVSPDWPESARCGIPRIQPVLQASGPRSPAAPWEWRYSDPAAVSHCIRSAREFMAAAADSIGLKVSRLYQSLGSRLSAGHQVAVAFRMDSLPGFRGLCERPYTGVSATAGAEDGPTRLRGWRLLGTFELGFEEGGSAINPHPAGCHREKRIALGETLQDLLTGSNSLAQVAQMTVLRIGDLVLGALPAEVTTVAGYEMKRAMSDSIAAAGGGAGAVAIIGMANGYIQYVTSDAEYRAQHYEGGSTIYGPRTASVLAGELASLAAAIERAGGRSPVNEVPEFTGSPGELVSVMPSRASGPPPTQIRRTVLLMRCRGDTVTVHWVDAYPGRLFPADGMLLEIHSKRGENWVKEAGDGDPDVEVRALRPANGGFLWEALWSGRTGTGPWRFIALERPGVPLTSRDCH